MKSCRKAAQEWNTTERAVTRWCTERRIEGAVKQERKWFLLDDALKPGDLRFRTGFYRNPAGKAHSFRCGMRGGRAELIDSFRRS